ncbi:DUF2284 domain-containing protein [Geomesophilobacter sediminis]|uniref:O-methyltransferase C-terminal domain-containing protein n=1 Tax=Geomesophilobacter sediminis TaxID=2798584 RepID=A0A8J7M2R0_9BACT|nr:DUF2284 domain-containing protein [Geomesophilobacter sediminis]MBJ6727558.1 hypothetical protein [Geomesophilobacter sediminis]
MKIAPSENSYLKFSQVVAGYRVFQLVRHAVRLGVFEAVGSDGNAAGIIKRTGMKEPEGKRFLDLLTAAGLLERYADHYYLSQFSRKFLLKDAPLSQLDVVNFEEVVMAKWAALDTVLVEGQGARQAELPEAEYRERLRLFQGAMHQAAVVRADELWTALDFLPEHGTIIDVGSGDGTYLKAFLERHPNWDAVACDLADVLTLSALEGYPAVTTRPCNILDAEESAQLCAAWRGQASVLLFSNVLHCYNAAETADILGRLKDLVASDGLVVVHDFFSDANDFSALYDGHMLANTYSGRTYGIDETKRLLDGAGFCHASEYHLPSASSVVVASARPLVGAVSDPLPLLQREALALGLIDAKPLPADSIRVEPWVKAKCRYGCGLYGRKWSCPPHSMDAGEFAELLTSYRRALLVVGQPPLRDFQERLLELEKRAFLQGMKKALVFSGGPCVWCESCPEPRCAFPEKRRPSLESCGCDVFELAASCGINLRPVKEKDDFVQYVGMLLVD